VCEGRGVGQGQGAITIFEGESEHNSTTQTLGLDVNNLLPSHKLCIPLNGPKESLPCRTTMQKQDLASKEQQGSS
jgi:hypothetical protein